MQSLDLDALKFVSGGANALGIDLIDAAGATSDGNTIATQTAMYQSSSGWKDGETGAMLGDFFYNLGKNLGWW